MRRLGLTILWPQYFDKTRTVKLGRRLPLNKATQKPTLEDLFNAAQKAGYHAELDPIRKYPRTWWDDPGIVLVDSMGQKKTFVMNKIAPYVSQERIARIEKAKQDKSKKKNVKKQQNMELLKAKIKKHRKK